MALLSQRILRGLVPARFSPDRPPARRAKPDRIVLGVQPGHRPSDKPPVRIYLGTERGQFRAERIFLWSVEKHRDPSRIYEIYLLRDLKGFRRGFWLTGFTNYRFAIPGFAGFSGRAIYNDADQVYLTDPAELFDLDMDQAGFLSINDRDTSVMLIDCERMAQAWNDHDVRRLGRKKLEARARQLGLWGDLDNGWNARDSEYDPQRSRLVHFTTLHTQPWRPFPGQFVYFDNPTDPLWSDLEAEAIDAHFMPVSATRPSRDWANLRLYLSSRPDGELLTALLDSRPSGTRQERLIITDLLERVPDQDVPWVLDRLFGACDRLEVRIREPLWHRPSKLRRRVWFWVQHFQQAGRLHPDTRWRLDHAGGGTRRQHHCGGPARKGSVVALLHRKPGHDQQARSLARELAEHSGGAMREVSITSGETGFFLGRLFGMARLPVLPEDAAIVTASGWLPTRIANRLQRRDPELRLVLSGRKAGPPEETGRVLIQCRHFGLPPHPRRLQTRLPLNAGINEQPGTPQRWQEWTGARHRVALLVGGDSRSHRLDARQARELAETVSGWARARQARLLVVTSRRSAGVVEVFRDHLGDNDLLYAWAANDPENPYALALAEAHDLIVTGESESMIADAASRGRGFLIWPLAKRRAGPWQRLGAAVAERAVRPRFNRRGSIRPQQGLTYLCARAIERAWVLPPRSLDQLHHTIIGAGLAARFGDPAPASFRADDEHRRIIHQITEELEIQQMNGASGRNRPPQEEGHDH